MSILDFVDAYTGTLLTFISTVTGHVLSWPVAIAVLAGVFYRPIAELIGRVRSGKVAGVEFEIRERLREAGMAAEESLIESRAPQTSRIEPETKEKDDSAQPGVDAANEPGTSARMVPSEPDRKKLDDLAAARARLRELHANIDGSDLSEWPAEASPLTRRLSTVGSILRAYSELEASIEELFNAVGGQGTNRPSAWRQAIFLRKRDFLNDAFLEAMNDLRQIRNQVVHFHDETSPVDARDFARTAERLNLVVQEQLVDVLRASLLTSTPTDEAS